MNPTLYRDKLPRDLSTENQTKYRKMTRKPWNHVGILIHRTWAITTLRCINFSCNLSGHTSFCTG